MATARALAGDRRGLTQVEYLIIVALLAIGLIAGWRMSGQALAEETGQATEALDLGEGEAGGDGSAGALDVAADSTQELTTDGSSPGSLEGPDIMAPTAALTSGDGGDGGGDGGGGGWMDWLGGFSRRLAWSLNPIPDFTDLGGWWEFKKGQVVGVAQGAWGIVTGLWDVGSFIVRENINFYSDPVGYVQHRAEQAQWAIENPGKVWEGTKRVAGSIWDSIVGGVNTFATGDPYEAGKISGNVALEVGLTVATAGWGHATKVRYASKLDDVADVARVIDKVDDATDVARTVDRVDDAADAARVGDDVADASRADDAAVAGRVRRGPNDPFVTFEDGYVPDRIFMDYIPRPIPAEGWKLHVTATIDNASDVADVVLPYLRQQGINHKVVRTGQEYVDLMRGTQQGKFITIYAGSSDEAARISRDIDRLLAGRGYGGPAPPGEIPIGDSGMIYGRYGGFTKSTVTDPSGVEVPDVRGHAYPPWIELPPEFRP